MREYFCAYHSMQGALRKLSDAEVGRLFRGLLYYSATGEEPTGLDGRESLLFDVYAQQIDRDIAAYNAKCDKLRANASRRKQKKPDAGKRDQGKEKDKDDDNAADAANPFGGAERPPSDTLEAYISARMTLNGRGYEELQGFKRELPENLIKYAVDDACDNNAPSWAYVRKVLQRYIDQGLQKIADVEAAKRRYEAGKGKRQQPETENPLNRTRFY